MYQKITVQLTNLLQIHSHVLLPKLTKHTLFGLNSVTQFLYLRSPFCHSAQTKLYYRKLCLMFWGRTLNL